MLRSLFQNANKLQTFQRCMRSSGLGVRNFRVVSADSMQLTVVTWQRQMSANSKQLLVTTPASCRGKFRQYSSSKKPESSPVPTVKYMEIKELPKHPEKLLIDVREPEELKETGQIPTSINIPLDSVSSVLDPHNKEENFKTKYGRSKPNLDTEIIFSCRLGKRALRAAQFAISLGYSNVKFYEGSWTDWAEREGLPK